MIFYNSPRIVCLCAVLLIISACTNSPNTTLQSGSTPQRQPSTAPVATDVAGATQQSTPMLASQASVMPAAVTTQPSAQPQAVPANAGCSNTPLVTSTLPPDTIIDQSHVNCFAWQSFIALNWPASSTERGQPDASKTAQDFGTPNDTSLTVWQSYKAPEDVFLPGAVTPQPWNTPDQPPPACAQIAQAKPGPNVVILRMISKFDDFIPDTVEASGEILVDQAGNMVRYEKRINQDEFNYIIDNKLYNADTQAVVALSAGIRVPTTTIELKAAWRVLEGQPSSVISRYKTAEAILYDPTTNTCSSPTLMGLVGLHIIRKTPHLEQIMWSTFEQIDNVPGVTRTTAPQTTPPYSFNNPNCQSPDPCTPNATPLPTPAPPAQPTFKPVQVTRRFAIPTGVQTLNTSVQKTIQQANPNSVWQYYQLVDALWPQNNEPNVPGPKATIPIPIAGSGFTTTGNEQLSNVTMETYVQQNSCLNCHASAALAPSKAAGCDVKLASDFSFIFDNADTPDHFRQTCQQSSSAPAKQAGHASQDSAHQVAIQCLECHPARRKP